MMEGRGEGESGGDGTRVPAQRTDAARYRASVWRRDIPGGDDGSEAGERCAGRRRGGATGSVGP